MTHAGHTAYEQWRAAYGVPVAAPASDVLPKLPGRQHEAIAAASHRPDHLLPGIGSGAPQSFNQRTLAAVQAARYADMRPSAYAAVRGTWEQIRRPLFPTPAGRRYARQHANIPCSRRPIVIISG